MQRRYVVIRVRSSLDMPASAERVWALLTDWESHSRWIPATEVRVLEGDGGLGTRFVGRSSLALAVPRLPGRARDLLGRAGFDDPMTVTAFEPPSDGHAGRCEIVKTGSVVLGTAGFTVAPTGADSCTVTWWEDVEVAPARLTRWADPLAARVATYGFDRVLRAARSEL
jgi:carbon monoxide dehydrogenase subunit G